MFINFWYPAEESALLGDDPLKLTMLGQEFVLWRDSAGAAHCISNTCTHRGGSLADGIIDDDCIQCPYHGWLFNGNGDCERIPSLGPLSKIPGRSHIDAYPVEERYGLVFVFLGDQPEAKRPPIMSIPEWGQEGWATVRTRYRWNANYVRLVENQSDPSHVEYVHKGFGMAGKNTDYKVPKIDVQKSEWGAGALVEFHSPELPDKDMKHMQGEGRNLSGSGYHGAASTWTNVNFNAQNKFHIYLFALPHTEEDLEIFLISQRNCMLEEERNKNFLERILIAVEEDRVVVEKLNPTVPSKDAVGEFIVPADDVLMNYRERLHDWQGRGWRIDVDEMKRNTGRVAYAIPGPARREHDDWAVTPVPML